MTAPDPKFTRGDKIRLQATPEMVGLINDRPTRRQGQYWYSVFFSGARTSIHPEEDLEIYLGQSDPASMLRDGRFSGQEALSKLVTYLKLSTSLRSQVYALFSSRTQFFPYQFKPLLKFLDSRGHRLLIADEVGLGKTIEAGLILTELRQRRPDMSRILLVPPSHLCHKWREEMQRRFDRRFDVLDSRGVHDMLRRYERDGLETEFSAIVSLQTLRSRSLMDYWRDVAPEIDFVVFDEAGRLRNPGTLSHRAARAVSEAADAVLLLTATPVQTGHSDLFNLLRILDPEEFERYEVFVERLQANRHILSALRELRSAAGGVERCLQELVRLERTPVSSRFLNNPLYSEVVDRLRVADSPTRRDLIELQRDITGLGVFGHILSRSRKRDVNLSQPQRRARVVRCEASSAERQFYEEVTRICRDAYDSSILRGGGSFGVMQPQRQMASCMVAMIDYLEGCLAGAPDATLDDTTDVDPDEESNGVDRQRSNPKWHELGDLGVWRQRLFARDTKLMKLRQVVSELDVEEAGAKVIVFTFFKRTVAYLRAQLKRAGLGVEILTGDTPTNHMTPELDERLKTIERFRSDPSIRVLIATEVADEGLDLQFAHCMVNYDLPWNPMRIEQRIGRIDRIGQKAEAVTIVSLSMTGTIEDRILDRLYDRVNIFESSIGDLEAILGEEIAELQRDLFARHLSANEEELRIQQTADAIERKKQDLESLEREADALVGHDEFFANEIRRAEDRHRYVGGDELMIYVRDFLKEHHRECKLAPADGGDRSRLSASEELRRFVRQTLGTSDVESNRFVGRTLRGDIYLTVDPEEAEGDPTAEFLTFYHPLVRAITQYYDGSRDELHPVSQVRVTCDDVDAREYVWLLYLTEITGARPQRDLELVAIRLKDEFVLDVDQSERLLWHLVSGSRSVHPAQRRSAVPDSFIERAEEVLTGRLGERFAQRRRANDALVVNQLSSLRETFERNLELRRQRLAAARGRGRAAAYIKGLETRIRTLEEGYNGRVVEIEKTRAMARSYGVRGAGIVEVVGG